MTLDRRVNPYTGDIDIYGSGPEHMYFDYSGLGSNDQPSAPLPPDAPMMPNPGFQRIRPGLGRDRGGLRTAADFQEAARPGIADLTMGNLGRALKTGLTVTTGITSPVQTLAGVALDKILGRELPFSDLTGYSRIDPDLLATIRDQRTLTLARQAQEKRNNIQKSVDRLRANMGASRMGAHGRGGFGNGASDGMRSDRTPGETRGAGVRGYESGGAVHSGVMRRRLSGYADGGPILSATPGRADAVETTAEPGAFIMPADVVSGLGDGNTDAGINWLDNAVKNLLGNLPRDVQAVMPDRVRPYIKNNGGGVRFKFDFARGGRIPIRASGGEYMVPRAAVVALGRGSHERGSRRLEALINDVRKRTAQLARQLPKPRR